VNFFNFYYLNYFKQGDQTPSPLFRNKGYFYSIN